MAQHRAGGASGPSTRLTSNTKTVTRLRDRARCGGGAAAAAGARAGFGRDGVERARTLADGSADGAVADSAAVANDHDPPSLASLKTTFNITCNKPLICLNLAWPLGRASRKGRGGR